MKHGTLAAGILVVVLALTRIRYLVTTDNSPLASLDRKAINTMLLFSFLRFLLVLSKPAAASRWQRVSTVLQAGLLVGLWISKFDHHITYAFTAYKSETMKTCMEATSHYFLEGFLGILQQGPLYHLNILPVWVVTLIAVFDAALTAAVAVNQIQAFQTTFMVQFFKESLPIAVLPCTMHTLLPKLEAKSMLGFDRPAAAPSSDGCGKKEPFVDADGLGAKQKGSQPCASDKEVSDTQKPDCQQLTHIKKITPCTLEQTESTSTAPSSMKQPSARVRYKHMPYRSNLTRPSRQVSIKLRSGLRTTDLPPDLAIQLQTSLRDICGCSYAISNSAVREGCILVRFDLLPASQPSAVNHNTSHNTETDDHSAVSSEALTKAMLCVVQPLLRNGVESDLLPLAGGEHARVQLDNKVLRCYWNADKQQWRFTSSCDGSVSDNEQKQLPELGLIRVATSNNGGSSEQDSDGTTALAYGDPATIDNTAACQSQQCSCKKVMLLDVDVNGFPSEWSNKVLLSRIQGWTAPSGKHDRQDVDWEDSEGSSSTGTQHNSCDDTETIYQLLAHSNGNYLNTHIRCVRQQDASTRCRILVDITNSVCHHSGQPIPCLQVLTLELWSKEILISSQTAVLPATCGANGHVAAPHAACWWWGCKSEAATAAVTELQEFTAKQHEGEDAWQHGDLLHDMCVWLLGVRDVAQTNGHCVMPKTDRTTIARMPDSPLDQQHLLEVGKDLLNYTHEANLPHVKAMLQQQLAFVEWCHSTSATPQNAGFASRILGALYVLWTSACGYSCAYCEQLYRQRLSRQLAGIQALCACLLISNSSLLLIQAMQQRDTVYLWILGTWYVPLSWICIRYIMNKNNARKTCSSGSAWGLCLSATWWVMVGSGTVATPPGVLKLSTTVTSASFNLLLSIAEQLQASTTLPAAFVTAIAMCIPFCQAAVGFGIGPYGVAGALNLLFNVVARLLADIHLRSMLMKLPYTNQAC